MRPGTFIARKCFVTITAMHTTIFNWLKFLPYEFLNCFQSSIKTCRKMSKNFCPLSVEFCNESWHCQKLFLTCSWHQKTNSPIHEFKVLQNVFKTKSEDTLKWWVKSRGLKVAWVCIDTGLPDILTFQRPYSHQKLPFLTCTLSFLISLGKSFEKY